jgi:hypothetical protein
LMKSFSSSAEEKTDSHLTPTDPQPKTNANLVFSVATRKPLYKPVAHPQNPS